MPGTKSYSQLIRAGILAVNNFCAEFMQGLISRADIPGPLAPRQACRGE